MSNSTEKSVRRAIERAADALPTLAGAFASDPSRAERFTISVDRIRADFSMQHVSSDLMSALVALAELRGVPAHRDAMFRGDVVNATEGRKVLHVALRARGGSREADKAAEQMARARALADELRRQPNVCTVVNIGIGGSDLGPAMASRALRSHRDGPECRFVSNIDPADLDEAISGLDPAETVFVVSSPSPLPGCPLIIDPSGFWLRPEGRYLITGREPIDDRPDLPLEPDWREIDEAQWMQLAHRIGALQALRVERAWAGYYEMNLFDHNAFIGPHPGLSGYAVICGFSGHGMQHAPGAGLALAEWLIGGQPRSVDVRALGLQRWLDGQPLREANVIG